jgi:biotin carboxylase
VPSSANRLLLLLPTTTYRTEAFVEAATKLGVELVCASERPSTLEHLAPDALVTLDFADPRASAETVARFAARRPIDAVVPADDLTTVVAAAISQRLGLKANSLPAVALARNKHAMRRCLAAAGVPVPRFRLVPLADDPAARAAEVEYPCVLKPLALSASRGVIRANDSREFVAAFHRIAAILESVKAPLPDEARQALLAEEFIPGREVALEGLLIGGTLHVLAIFDKPDPLDGPFFEETIYVTPSRLAEPVQARLAAVTRDACSALGLTEGPIHAELRLNERGPFVLEVAARSIGGLCSRTLTFGTGLSLEELILCHALGRPLESLERERRAAGVMMVPIPRAGRLASVHGAAEAAAVDGVEEVAITMHPGQEVVPLPEGWQYLGFIFARAETPVAVEHALRQAHARLHFTIE